MQRSELIRERLKECIHNGELSNEDLVKIFEHIRDLLNLQTIESFRKEHKLSYNGVKFRKNLRIFIRGKQFIVDNE